MAYDKQAARTIADRALAALAKEFGPDVVTLISTKYGGKVAVNFEFTLGGEQEKAALEHQDFVFYAPMFGVSAEQYKSAFTTKGEIYEIIGFEVKRQRYPVRARNVASGKVMLFTDSVLARLATRAVAA